MHIHENSALFKAIMFDFRMPIQIKKSIYAFIKIEEKTKFSFTIQILKIHIFGNSEF